MATTGTCPSTDPRHYIWWFPGSPVRVHIDLGVVERLQERLRNSGSGVPEHGLLFGRVLEGATEIIEFQPASGRSVPEMIADFAMERGKRLLVGYYRTEAGETLRLNEDDLALFKTFFGKAYHVFLLIQPNAFAAPNATFFFSRGDHQISEFPFLEFPLDASLLATEERDRILRRERAVEKPAAVEPPLPPAPLPPPASVEARPRPRLLKIAPGMLAVGLLAALAWIAVPLVRARSPRVWSAILSAISRPPASASSSSSTHPRLGLEVRRQDRDLELTWSHDSSQIASATSGLVSIEDGSVEHQISLDVQQLRGESILYSPTSDQVLIQLTVTAPTGVATESVRVIRAGGSTTYKAAVASPVGDFMGPRQSPPENARSAPVLKPFAAPPLNTHIPEPAPLSEPPPFVANPQRAAPPLASFDVPQALAAPRAMARPAAPPATGQGLTDLPVSTGTSKTTAYHPPEPLREVTPTYPAELQFLTTKAVVVAVRVSIDAQGKVRKAVPIPEGSVHRLFIMEAVHAAQLWRFRPALQGNQPVPSESILRFTFTR